MTVIVSTNEVAGMLDKFCSDNNIPREAIVLGGGGALMMRGLRKTTQDLNVWVEEEYFTALAEKEKVIVHPMVDVPFNPKAHPYFWLRKYNPYFKFDVIDGVQCFDIVTSIIHKRGGFAKVERPLAKREQDKKDLVILGEIFSNRNRVLTV